MDAAIMKLRSSLIGTWESDAMVLRFNGEGPDTKSSGSFGSTKDKTAMAFDYQVLHKNDKFFISMAFEFAGIREYEVMDYGNDNLVLGKSGYQTYMNFMKRPQAEE